MNGLRFSTTTPSDSRTGRGIHVHSLPVSTRVSGTLRSSPRRRGLSTAIDIRKIPTSSKFTLLKKSISSLCAARCFRNPNERNRFALYCDRRQRQPARGGSSSIALPLERQSTREHGGVLSGIHGVGGAARSGARRDPTAWRESGADNPARIS